MEPYANFKDVLFLKHRMENGLKPAELTRDEYDTLVRAYGDDWFTVLEYSDRVIERSRYDPKHQYLKSREEILIEQLHSGLPLTELAENEVLLLGAYIGQDWFYRLGFSDDQKHPYYRQHSPYDTWRLHQQSHTSNTASTASTALTAKDQKIERFMLERREHEMRQQRIRDEYIRSRQQLPKREYKSWSNVVQGHGTPPDIDNDDDNKQQRPSSGMVILRKNDL